MIDLEPLLLRLPLDEPVYFAATTEPVNTLPVALVGVTAGEQTAYGEALVADPAVLVAAVDFFADTVANSRPDAYGLIYQRLCALMQEYDPQPHADYASVLSALDVALWDLAARELNVPCWRLLGGARTRLVDLAVGGLAVTDPALEDRAKRLRKQFGALEVTLAGEAAVDIRGVKIVRRAVGDEAPLLVNAAGTYSDPTAALAVGQALDRAEVFWFAEPLPPGQWAQCRALREAIGPAVAAGGDWTDLTTFETALAAEALDVAVCDVRLIGGLSGARQLADLCGRHGTRLSLRAGLSPLAQLAGAQLAAAYHHAGPLQVLPPVAPLAAMLEPAPVWRDGFLRLPEGPGLGAAVVEEFLSTYRVELPDYE